MAIKRSGAVRVDGVGFPLLFTLLRHYGGN